MQNSETKPWRDEGLTIYFSCFCPIESISIAPILTRISFAWGRIERREIRMKVVILWQGLSGYLLSWVTALTARNCKVLLVYTGKSDDAPFNLKIQSENVSNLSLDELSRKELLAKVNHFQPDIVLISSWHISKYRYVARRITTPRILCMDNQWHSTPKQWLGVLSRSIAVRPLYDRALVPGHRQRFFARKLGFQENEIWDGLLSADSVAFSSTSLPRNNEFLFVGRIVKEKGIDLLTQAYSQYRKKSINPLNLRVCGVGKLSRLLEGREGIIWNGFIDPSELPAIYGTSKIFIMPSTFEPWGVAIHEAAISGLMIIASDACGAVENLVEDGWNGLIVPSGNVEALCSAMLKAEIIIQRDFRTISQRSKALSDRYSPDKWAENLLRHFTQEFVV